MRCPERSQGGSDFDLNRLVALCRSCHEQTDAPYDRGELIVSPRGLGQFAFEVVQRAGRCGGPGRGDSAHVGKVGRAGGAAEFAHVGNDEVARA